MPVIAKWVITALAMLAAAAVVPGITIASFPVALFAAAILGLLNVFVRPLLFIITLPITILTLGLFTFVINGFLFWLLGIFLHGVRVDGIFAACLGALIVTVAAWASDRIFRENTIA